MYIYVYICIYIYLNNILFYTGIPTIFVAISMFLALFVSAKRCVFKRHGRWGFACCHQTMKNSYCVPIQKRELEVGEG